MSGEGRNSKTGWPPPSTFINNVREQSYIATDYFFSGVGSSGGGWPRTNTDGSAPSYLIAGPDGYGSISLALAAAAYGDIVIVQEGTYTDDIAVPVGVTLRAEPCKTVTIIGEVVLLGQNTIRGISFEKGAEDYTITLAGDMTVSENGAWFEECKFRAEGPFGTFTSPLLGNVVFRRCFFTDQGDFTATTMAEENGAGLLDLEFASCIFEFLEQNTISFSIASLRKITMQNNTTVVGYNSGGTAFFLDTPPTQASVVTRNLFLSKSPQDAKATYLEYVDNYTVQYNKAFGFTIFEAALTFDGLAVDSTNTTDSYIARGKVVDIANGVYSQRYDVPGGLTTVSRDTLDGPLVDYNGIAFADSPSVGAYQLTGDNSALYRPWFDVDILSNFALTYSQQFGQPLVLDPDIMAIDKTFNSHLDLACWVNAYVQDVMHPSRGVFYTDYLGNYRLKCFEGTFDLYFTGDAATILGAYDRSGIADTG